MMVGVIWVMRLVMVVVMEAELFCTRLASGNRLLQVLVYVTTIRKPKEKEQDVEEEKLAVIQDDRQDVMPLLACRAGERAVSVSKLGLGAACTKAVSRSRTATRSMAATEGQWTFRRIKY